MNIKDFKAGSLQNGGHYQYFMPASINHTFYWTDEALNELLEKAAIKLGELNSFARLVPDIRMFIIMHVYKEAVLSSRIEGTKTMLEEALLEEKDVDPEKRNDWKEVNNYAAAMNFAIDSLNKLPLSGRLIRDTHRILLQSVRGEHKAPGEFRKSQNWIGGAAIQDAVFIPPLHTDVPELMSDLEKFLHNEEIKVPHLVRIAIAHYQFETIHPFLDGNGRIGRLLITLYLISKEIMEKPLLYLSDFFEKNKGLYYDNLSEVRRKDGLAQWIRFFLSAVIETADKSAQTLKKIINLKSSLEQEKILNLGKRVKTGQKLLQALFCRPVIQVKDVEKEIGLSPKAANDMIREFLRLKILNEITGYQRNRVFAFEEYIKLFD